MRSVRYVFFSAILLVLVFTTLFSQGPDILWTKTFGGIYDDIGYSVRQTSDGGYIIAGFTCSFGAGENDIYLIKTDKRGDILWSKTYGDKYNDRGYSVLRTFDQGYILTGFTIELESSG